MFTVNDAIVALILLITVYIYSLELTSKKGTKKNNEPRT